MRIESLAVESFATGAAAPEKGTVEGHANTRNQNTCQASCFGTCAVSCDYTCKCVPTEPYETCYVPCVPPPITYDCV